MGFALVVIKDNAGRSVQLGYNYPLGAIDNESTVFSHQWNFTKVDFLLADILDSFVSRFFVVDYQANSYSQGN